MIWLTESERSGSWSGASSRMSVGSRKLMPRILDAVAGVVDQRGVALAQAGLEPLDPGLEVGQAGVLQESDLEADLAEHARDPRARR